MAPWIVAVQFFLGLVVLGFCLSPVLASVAGRSVSPTSEDESDYEMPESFVQVMSDLEYDYETGKLSREDYERLRKQVFREAEPDVPTEESEPEEPEGQGDGDDLERAVKRARDQLDL